MTELITLIRVQDTDGGSPMPWVHQFGRDDWSWNLDDPDYQTDASDGSGLPGIGVIGQAIQVWLSLWGRNATVGMIANVFNLPPSLVDRIVAYDGNMLYHTEGNGVSVDGA